ncbi:MAG TPA: cell division protein ZipA C-terminal FtsZ-binding domain-containing protein [Steroidobacteraceae bacterium]|nr:cell division protein ZipA C-terminal FtsZ-binding domain-containing protein [Steroidobacteraceae bacterium]
MSELRWILIGFGIVLLAAIYLWGRRGNRAVASGDDALMRVRPEPSVHSGETTLIRHVDEAPVAAPPAIEVVTPDEPLPVVELGETWRGRLEPTFADAPTEELPVHPAPTPAPAAAAPTLSSSEAPQARRVERRKILSLRLASSPQRIEGAKLMESLLAESLQHGKYSIFHRVHSDGTIIFSVASMVEPGSFDLEKMNETLYTGITMFTQLPGPVPGMHALNELVACARRLQANLGGTLQDERGVPLTVHRIERMRQEVRDFERPPAGRGAGSQSAHV